MNKPTAKIENWTVYEGYLGDFLVGTITEHYRPELVGHECHTSVLVWLDREKGIAETRNTIYTLGKEAQSNGSAATYKN